MTSRGFGGTRQETKLWGHQLDCDLDETRQGRGDETDGIEQSLFHKRKQVLAFRWTLEVR